MALSYNIKMVDKKLSEEILLEKFQELGYKHNNTEVVNKGICLDFYDDLGFYVYLIDSSNYPYNIWESILYDGDFVHEKILEFRLNKDYDDLEKRYKVMLSIIFDLMLELKEEALFISNDVTELCCFRKDGQINLNNKTGIWERKYFKDVIQDKNTHIIIPNET